MTRCNSALGNLAVEDKKPSKTGLNITSKFLEGKITSAEAIKQIKNTYLGGNNNE